MKVILEFPQESADETSTIEVKSLLSDMLSEHLEKQNNKEKQRKIE